MCGWAQPAAGGSAGDGQDDAGAADPDDPAASEPRGEPGDDADLLRARAAAGRGGAAGPSPGAEPAPLGERAEPRGRREHPASGGGVAGAPWGAVSRRAARVLAVRSGDAAAADGKRERGDRPGQRGGDVPGEVHARGGDEPVGLGVRGEQHRPAGPLSRQAVGASAGPHRHPRRGADRAVPRADGQDGRHGQPHHARAGDAGPRDPAQAVR